MRLTRQTQHVRVVNISADKKKIDHALLPGGSVTIGPKRSLLISAQIYISVYRKYKAWLVRSEVADKAGIEYDKKAKPKPKGEGQ